MGDEESKLPPKVYFRIGEVASLVGVEPHVLRYWEREFRTIRPKKSARGQRVYSRKDVETLMRVRQLLYSEGFTIAGARRRLQQERSGGSQTIVEPLEVIDALADGAAVDGAPLAIAAVSTITIASAPEAETGAVAASASASAAPARSPDGEAAPRKRVLEAERVESIELVEREERIERAERAERADLSDRAEQGAMRSTLRELRREIETFLAEL